MGSPTVQQLWMRAIRDDRTLKAGGKAVLYTLATHMDADGSNCRPGMQTVADEAGMTRTTAFEWLEKGKRAGLVIVQQRTGASVYMPAVGGVPLVANRPGNPNSKNASTVRETRTVGTVRETGTVGVLPSGFSDSNRSGIPNRTRADQEGKLASSPVPQPKDRADQALARHGIPLTDRPSIERFLREVKKATSPGGLIVTLEEQGRLGAVLVEWRAWAAPAPTPPRLNGAAAPACSYECEAGWLEDPDDDERRPFRCPDCRPRRPLNTTA